MTPTKHIEKIHQAFADLRDGLMSLESFLLDWANVGQEHHHTSVAEPYEETMGDAEEGVGLAEVPVEKEDADSFPYTFEDVRQILGPIAKDGGKQAIQDALKTVGAQRLSDVDPKHYAKLVDTVQQAVA